MFLADQKVAQTLYDLVKQQKASGILALLAQKEELKGLLENMKKLKATHIISMNQYVAMRTLYPNYREYSK